MSWVISVACQGFLFREACVGVLVGGAVILMGIPLCVICCFPLAAFNILVVCGVLFIMELPHCGWGCVSGLSRFPG